MGLRYENLDDETRRLMLEELENDVAARDVYISDRLNADGQGNWLNLLRAAIMDGSDDSLAHQLRIRQLLQLKMPRRTPKGKITMYTVPPNAPDTLAEGQFNTYYMRALSRRVLDGHASRLVVYRGKEVGSPRESSEILIGKEVPAQFVLDELRRTKGVNPDTRIPLPNSGVTVRLA